jgi:hypothetical protein
VKVWKKILVTAVGRTGCYFRIRTRRILDHSRYSVINIKHAAWANEVRHDHIRHTEAKPPRGAKHYIEGDSAGLAHEDERNPGVCPF